MIIPLTPSALQPSHLILIQAPTDGLLELTTTDLLPGPFGLVGLEAWFEAGLHANAKGGVEGDGVGITTKLDMMTGRVGDGQEGVACGLDGKGARCVWTGDTSKGLFGRYGLSIGVQETESITTEISKKKKKIYINHFAKDGEKFFFALDERISDVYIYIKINTGHDVL